MLFQATAFHRIKSLIYNNIQAKAVTEKSDYCGVSVSCDLWWQAHNLSKKAVLCKVCLHSGAG